MRAVRGDTDLQRAADALAWRPPDELAVLARLAYDYRWAWTPGGSDLFRCVDPRRWRLVGGNPGRLVQGGASEAPEAAAKDDQLPARAAELETTIREDLDREAAGPVDPE